MDVTELALRINLRKAFSSVDKEDFTFVIHGDARTWMGRSKPGRDHAEKKCGNLHRHILTAVDFRIVRKTSGDRKNAVLNRELLLRFRERMNRNLKVLT